MSIKVLLVDDEMSFVETLAKRLTFRSFQVLTASSAERALEVLDREPVDVAVVDMKMPGMDGIQATQAIRARHPEVEVILLTGHASLEASRDGLKLGAFDYLLKPIRIDELVFAIEDAHRKRELNQLEKESKTEELGGDPPPGVE
jgi:DNA-binding NtrC family response regulator